MQPQPKNPSTQVTPEHVIDEKAGELRRHPGAREVGYGWLRIARPESFPDRVLLVSTLAPLSVTFPLRSADLDHRRASLSAGLYACRHPQQTRDDVEDAAENDNVFTPTAS
ncbi:hypothetical protein ACFPOU_17060 [Massilia jejuensis]|uniref:Uncharacterized protein n=1 Tax=Massilia jejuensis TaxID=648894 RepID=A0ABW0PJZ5_9BURK